MDLDKIKELVQLMVDNDLVEISLRDGAEEVNLRRPTAGDVVVSTPVQTLPLPQQESEVVPEPVAEETEQQAAAARTKEEEELVVIRSPMVGTFYEASSPDNPPFVTVGSQVTPDSVVCIVEAMKVFNEIKAEVAGTIEKILIANEGPVEYGQELYLVRPR